MHPILVTRSTLAHLLCLSDARTAQLVVSGVLPRPVKRGAYDVISSTRAYITHLKTATRGGLAAERERLTQAKADRAELDLKVRAHQLVAVADVQR
jgi:phage terminase Nu1 subunit (DNA packaging protein)